MRVATSLVRLFAHGAPEWHLYLGRLVGCCLLLIGLLVFPHRDAFAHRPAYTLDDLVLPQLHVDTLQGDSVVTQIAEFPASTSLSDTLQMLPTPEAPLRRNFLATSSHFTPNSTVALLCAIIPGGGQFYNRKYWKLPIFYGGLTGCIYAMTWNNQMYRDYQRAYKDIMDDDPNTQSYNNFLHLGTKITDANKSYYQSLFKKRKDRFRRWRDLSIFATVAVYALSVIDAYVDASLSNFDISDDLSLHISPVLLNTNSPATTTNIFKGSAIGIGCKLTF